MIYRIMVGLVYLLGMAACYVLILLSGCQAQEPAGRPPGLWSVYERYPDELDEAMRQAQVYRDPRPLTGAIVPGPELVRICPGARQGCFVFERETILISAQYLDEDRKTITHESMHWLSGQGDHEDPSYWGPDGALARTNRALGLGED